MSLQQAIEKKLGIKPVIKTGKPGDLKVLVNGSSIFDHKSEGGMPAIEEILSRIKA